jgi:hypothetical protein
VKQRPTCPRGRLDEVALCASATLTRGMRRDGITLQCARVRAERMRKMRVMQRDARRVALKDVVCARVCDELV